LPGGSTGLQHRNPGFWTDPAEPSRRRYWTGVSWGEQEGVPRDLRVTSPPRVEEPSDSVVLERIRSSKRVVTCKCLMCGYDGLMPVVNSAELASNAFGGLTVLLTLPVVLFVILVLNLGFIGGCVVGLIWFLAGSIVSTKVKASRIRYQCPMCLEVLKPKG